MDGGEQEVIRTLGNIDFHTCRQVLLRRFQQLFQVHDCLGRIRSSHLEDDTRHSLMSVHGIVETVAQSSQFNCGNVT